MTTVPKTDKTALPMTAPVSRLNTDIVLTTLNARYIHSAFGLRYLKANLGDLQDRCVIEEFTLESRPEEVVETLLQHEAKIIGFGVYIWNVVQTTQVLALLNAVAPHITVVLGGPEVSYENDRQTIVEYSDYVITGWGETSFRQLATRLLEKDQGILNQQKIIKGEQPKLEQITMPYDLYDDDDIKNRVLYVEASRGCPFKCEFCLSALDKTAWPFDLDLFLEQMDILYQRGARHFKFVDRTFNLKVKNSLRILEFFLARMDDDLFLHFEVVPDHLPTALQEMIEKFPVGSLQFEIGIQTFNPEVQARISRRQNNDQAKTNIRWIRQHSNAYVHADLIFGLPGEGVESFAESFNQLYSLRPHEIQVGILKRLKGSPIIRHASEYQLRFNPNPPFSILSTRDVSFDELQRMARFARYWDMVGNSGRFTQTLPILLEGNAFQQFMLFSDAVFSRLQQTHKISLLRLFDALHDIAIDVLGIAEEPLRLALDEDYSVSGLKSRPKYMLHERSGMIKKAALNKVSKRNHRQARQ